MEQEMLEQVLELGVEDEAKARTAVVMANGDLSRAMEYALEENPHHVPVAVVPGAGKKGRNAAAPCTPPESSVPVAGSSLKGRETVNDRAGTQLQKRAEADRLRAVQAQAARQRQEQGTREVALGLAALRKAGADCESKALELLEKVLGNIKRHPTDVKYQRLRLSNERVAAVVLHTAGAAKVLRTAGFVEDGDFMVFSDVGDPSRQALLDTLAAVQAARSTGAVPAATAPLEPTVKDGPPTAAQSSKDGGLGFVEEEATGGASQGTRSAGRGLGYVEGEAGAVAKHAAKVGRKQAGSATAAMARAMEHVDKVQARLDAAMDQEDYEKVARIQPLLENAMRALHELETRQSETQLQSTEHAEGSGKVSADDLLTVEELQEELGRMGFEDAVVANALPICVSAAETADGPMCLEDIISMLLEEEEIECGMHGHIHGNATI